MKSVLISDDKKNDLLTLLQNPNQLTIHQKNLQALINEAYKMLNGYAGGGSRDFEKGWRCMSVTMVGGRRKVWVSDGL